MALCPRDGAVAGHGFDPPHTSGDAALGDDREEADVAGGGDMGAATQLHAEAGHADDANRVAVFFTEERHGAGCDRLLRRPHVRLDRRVAYDLLVDDPLDPLELFARDRLKVDEIEAQPVRGDERTFLRHVRAEHLAKRGVQQMRCSVVSPRRVPYLRVDFGGDEIPHAQRS